MRIISLILIWFLFMGVGASRNYDGVNDEIYDTSVSGIDTDAMSVSYWLYDRTSSAQTSFMTASDKSAGNSALAVNQVTISTIDQPTVQYRWTTSFGNWDGTSGTFAINTWQHICGTYDRGSTSNNATIVLNGSIETVNERDTPAGTAKTGVDVILIGENVGGGADYDGLATHVQFWGGREITTTECIETMWKPGMVPQTMDVMLLFDQLTDTSGNGHVFTNEGSTSSAEGPPVSFGGMLPL